MPFEYEALVGNLHVVGGRAISAPPPGTLVEVAPRKAARGREADTFFVLVLPNGDSVAPATFYEQMAQLAAERYFNSTGSVTSGLREVFNTLNQNLFEHNASGKRPYEANMLCAVLRGADLIVGRIGSGVVLLRDDAQIRTFPEDLEDDDAIYIPPLGVQPIPNVKLTQYRVAHRTRLVLADANIADFDRDKVHAALRSNEITGTLLAFKELARLQLMLIAVEFVPPEEPVPELAVVGESTAQFTATGKARTASKATGETAAVALETTAEGAAALGEPAPITPPPPEKPRRARESAAVAEAAQEVQRRVGRGMGSGALLLARFFAGVNRLLDKFFPPPKEGQRGWISSPAAAGLVVLVPVIVVAMVIVLWLSGTGESEFELCVEEALRRRDTVSTIPSSERQTVLSLWDQTLQQVETCRQLRPDDPLMLAIRAEGRDVIDRLSAITRRDVYPVDTFVGAQLSQIIVQGADLYVLDSNTSQVYQVQLTADGRQRASVGQAIPAMRQGAVVSGYTIGEIFDITFSTEDNVVMALDRAGVLIKCTPRFLQCDAQQLIGAENWTNGRPTAITTWSGRLYVLDAAVGQIWRYEQSGDDIYASAPSEYFGGQSRIGDNVAVDFDIQDDTGTVYVALVQGGIRKYFGGSPQETPLVAVPAGQELTSVDSMYLDDNPVSNILFLVSRERASIYEFTLGGTFIATYRPQNEEAFGLISAIATSPGQDMVYVASGNAVLAFVKGR